MKESKVFLGGTCANGTDWRDDFIAKFVNVKYFNPLVEDWDEEAKKKEDLEKRLCNIHLYVITYEMEGVYSIAEAVESCHKKDKITIFHVYPARFDRQKLKSLQAVIELIRRNGGIAYASNSCNRTIQLINNLARTD